jgi:hypothetical protein
MLASLALRRVRWFKLCRVFKKNKLMKKEYILMLLVLFLTSCVSLSKYKKLEDKVNAFKQ